MIFEIAKIYTLSTSPESFFSVLTQYEKYPTFFAQQEILKKDVKKVVVKNITPHEKEVTYTVNPFWTLTYTYTLSLKEDPKKKEIHWKLTNNSSNQLFDKNEGYWKIIDNQAHYEAKVKFKSGIPQFILKKEIAFAEKEKLPLMLQIFSSEAQKMDTLLTKKPLPTQKSTLAIKPKSHPNKKQSSP